MSAKEFEGFATHRVAVHSQCLGKELEIFCRKRGSGPGLLLLHGFPQNNHIWHKVAARLSEQYTVVASDLRGMFPPLTNHWFGAGLGRRPTAPNEHASDLTGSLGYGQSDKPAGSSPHDEYSKREMASDQVQLMKHFGMNSFFVVGHDRGGRVAHRMALDHPESVKKMMILDIAPTLWMYDHTNMVFAKGYWHWFFLIQPSPGPENMIRADPESFWALMSMRETHQNVVWSEADLNEYKTAYFNSDTIHSTCEDYRAASTIDLEHDRADRAAGRRLKIQGVMVLWGGKGMIEKVGNAVNIWKEYSEDQVLVTGRALDCGHYIPEEKPEELLQEILGLMR
ncbi:MAG: hypothetical protein TREMPRED_001311 [Tremellales sp. Tagirdzhanova-0007]|nr:MAG: hypothetical protein TREMPRED_001311 [Tremellales sp. Tagirdzhanova-0007]